MVILSFIWQKASIDHQIIKPANLKANYMQCQIPDTMTLGSLVQPYVHYYYILNSIDIDNKGVHDEVNEIFKDCINFYSPPPNFRHLG